MGMEWGLGLWGEGRNGREGKAPETGKFERGLRSQGGQAEKATGTDDGEQNTGGVLLYDSCRESQGSIQRRCFTTWFGTSVRRVSLTCYCGVFYGTARFVRLFEPHQKSIDMQIHVMYRVFSLLKKIM